MKKILFFALFITISKIGVGQSVGIGTNNPNQSAALDISSNNKGVLFPKVLLLDSLDNTTIPNAAPNLMVFNINTALPGGKGLYYNKGTVFPRWEKVGEFKLPYSGTTVFSNPAFAIDNTGGLPTSDAIQGYSTNGAGVKGISTNGIGVLAYSGKGNSLEVSGKIKIAGIGQAPGVGKVLTSDAIGNATWQSADLIAFSSYGTKASSNQYSDNASKKVAFDTEEYDLGNNYNPSSGAPYSTFTAPINGIYHFDVTIAWEGSPNVYSYLSLIKDSGGATDYIQLNKIDTDNETEPQQSLSIDAKLLAGDKVYVTLRQSSSVPGTETLGSSKLKNYFTGHLVMKL